MSYFCFYFFFFNDTATTEIYTLSLHDALPISGCNIGAVEDSPSGPVLEADLTTNRPDCLGHYGMAREIAALYHVPLKNVTPKLQEAAEKAADAEIGRAHV